METEIRRAIRNALARADLQLVAVARAFGLDYGRLQRVVNGYSQPRAGEIEALLEAIDRLAAKVTTDTEESSVETANSPEKIAR